MFMPGDGNCLFHSLAYWARQQQRQVRETIARQAIDPWGALFPWGEGDEYADFLHATLTEGSGAMVATWQSPAGFTVSPSLWSATIRPGFARQGPGG